MTQKLGKILCQLDEIFLTENIICPLLETIHPGRIEYTHSNNEAGRDIISFGKDPLGREHVLCVQVKANKVTYGSQFNTIVKSPVEMAKNEGVTLANGTRIIPNEVWFITSSPFPSNKRASVADTLRELDKQNIKFIPGEEFASLVLENLNDIAEDLLSYSDKNILRIISDFSKHTDGVAFNLDQRRKIEEFYITASLTPYAYFAQQALSEFEYLKIKDYTRTYQVRLSDCIFDNSSVLEDDIEQAIIQTYRRRLKQKEYFTKHAFNFDIEILNVVKEEEGRPQIIDFNYFKNVDNLKNCISSTFLNLRETRYLEDYFENLKRDANKKISKCPKILKKRSSPIVQACDSINLLDSFLIDTIKKFPTEDQKGLKLELDSIDLKIKVPDPKNLLSLSEVLLIEGQPGCGKTTLLRRLFISLLEAREIVAYVPCFKMDSSLQNEPLETIIKKIGVGRINSRRNTNINVVILDGIDEAPFDLSETIANSVASYRNIIISGRSSYCDSIRKQYFNIMLAPFTTSERNKFFKNMNIPDDSGRRFHSIPATHSI